MSEFASDSSVAKAFEELFLEGQAGSPDSVQAFFDQYARVILRVIRVKMEATPGLRPEWGSEDFLQEARLGLLRCHVEERDFETPQAFLGFMIRLAERKVQYAKVKQDRRTKASAGNKSLDALSANEEQQMVDRAPQPLAAQVSKEKWENAMAALRPDYREIVKLIGMGYKHAEIAGLFNVSERTVRRAVFALAEVLRKAKEED